MAWTRFGAVGAFMLGASGCALVSGLSSLDVGTDGGATGDAATGVLDGASDGDLADAAKCACGVVIPPGFQPVLFANVVKDLKGECPTVAAQKLTRENVVVDPQTATGSGACTCGCTVGGCTSGTLTFFDSTACGFSLGSVAANGLCQASPNGYANTSSLRMSGATPTCTPKQPVLEPPYKGTAVVCTSPTLGCDEVCAGTDAGFRGCIVGQGDIACPQGATKTLVAASVTDARTCTGCTCSLGNAAGCSTSLQFFSDGQCGLTLTPPVTLAVDTCATSSAAGANFVAKITPAGTCSSSSGTLVGATAPVNVRTVCCRP